MTNLYVAELAAAIDNLDQLAFDSARRRIIAVMDRIRRDDEHIRLANNNAEHIRALERINEDG